MFSITVTKKIIQRKQNEKKNDLLKIYSICCFDHLIKSDDVINAIYVY